MKMRKRRYKERFSAASSFSQSWPHGPTLPILSPLLQTTTHFELIIFLENSYDF